MKYNVEIDHPNGSWATVTVRNKLAVSGEGLKEIGKLPDGKKFLGEIIVNEVTGNIGFEILAIEGDQKFIGGFCYMLYNGKDFGNWVPAADPDPVPGGNKVIGRVYLNHEKEFYPFVRKDQKAIPDTRPYVGASVKNNGRTTITKRHQYFWWNILKEIVPEWNANPDNEKLFKRDFIYIMDDKLAFFNDAGSDYRRVYPYNLNLTNKFEPAQNQIAMGGTLLEMACTSYDDAEMIFGEERLPFYVINAQDKNLEDYNPFDFPYRWLRPTLTWGPTVIRSEPFSTHYGRTRVPMYLNGTNIAWINARLVKILQPGEIPAAQFTKDWGR
jgi:hypothetical protein